MLSRCCKKTLHYWTVTNRRSVPRRVPSRSRQGTDTRRRSPVAATESVNTASARVRWPAALPIWHCRYGRAAGGSRGPVRDPTATSGKGRLRADVAASHRPCEGLARPVRGPKPGRGVAAGSRPPVADAHAVPASNNGHPRGIPGVAGEEGDRGLRGRYGACQCPPP